METGFAALKKPVLPNRCSRLIRTVRQRDKKKRVGNFNDSCSIICRFVWEDHPIERDASSLHVIDALRFVLASPMALTIRVDDRWDGHGTYGCPEALILGLATTFESA